MSGRPRSVPSYRKHKQSGQAIATLTDTLGRRRDVLLGKHGTAQSRSEYARVLAEWEAGGRMIPAAAPAADLTVSEMLLRFWQHAQMHYRHPDGRPSSEIASFKYALKPLNALYGPTLAASFGPLALKAVRAQMVKAGLCRNQCNRLTNRIRRVFKWAAGEELITPSILEGLRCVSGLARGRTEARESEPVKPVADSFVDAVQPFVSRSVWGMIRLQRLTGMRPNEVVQMRLIDIDRAGDVWLYRPATHKMSYRGTDRIVCLGQRAQAVIREFPTADEAFLFSPKRDAEERAVVLRLHRKTRVQPSQQNRRKQKPQKLPGDHFRRDSYTQAIANACEKAAVPVWGPNRLRHNYATVIRRQYGLEGSQVALGHARADVTQIYAERDHSLAEKIAAECG